MTKRQLPKTLYVKIEDDSEAPYFVADEELYSLVVLGEKIKVGKYQLVEVTFAEAVVKTSGERA